ncbi:MAG: YitT family protein [Alistipes sp.]
MSRRGSSTISSTARADKLLFIVSDRREQIRNISSNEWDAEAHLKASGLYTARDKEVIFVVVSRGEVSMVRSMVHEIDPTAFVVIVDADETYGDGFKPFPQKE